MSSASSIYYKQRWEIVFLCHHAKGPKMSPPSAAKYLRISPNAVNLWLERYKVTGTVDDIPKIGRPRATSDAQDRQIVNMMEIDNPIAKPITLQDISNKMSKKGVNVSAKTISRRLKETDLHYGNIKPKPLLTEHHMEKRLEWAEDNIDRDWSQIIYSDESTFRVTYHRRRIWKRRGQVRVIRTVKHPAKINLWGCFSAAGFGKLGLVVGNLKAPQLIKLYKRCLLPSATMLFGANNDNWELLEDNSPIHRAKIAKVWKAENGVKVMDWPY